MNNNEQNDQRFINELTELLNELKNEQNDQRFINELTELLNELKDVLPGFLNDLEKDDKPNANFTSADFLASPLLIGIKLMPDGDKQKIGLMVKIDQRITSSDVAAFCFHIKLATDKLMKDYVIDRVKGDDVKEITDFLKTNAARKYSNFLG